MTRVISTVGRAVDQPNLDAALLTADKALHTFIDEAAYVGEVYALGYNEALVQIHDHHRMQVGGIPALSFLIATRIHPSKAIDVREEDASIVLLRVLDHADVRTVPAPPVDQGGVAIPLARPSPGVGVTAT